MRNIDEQFSNHYREIGEIKRKFERKQELRIRAAFICVVIFIIAGAFNG